MGMRSLCVAGKVADAVCDMMRVHHGPEEIRGCVPRKAMAAVRVEISTSLTTSFVT